MDRCLLLALTIPLLIAVAARAGADDLSFRSDFLKALVAEVPKLLKDQDPKTGRFGQGIWICSDQNRLWPLAAAWAIESRDNPYYHDPKLLDAIMLGGDALIDDADEKGQWVFRKKDGSTWGMINMPWTYSRWVRAYSLITDAMPADRRKRWEDALIVGYTNIAKTQLARVHNIPAHHAMGLYIAGQALGRPEWCEQAKQFMAKVVEEQAPEGFWSEHSGPVVRYNFVYVDALGNYYGVSGDESVLPALERAARFHAAFTYPDGSTVETIDERNPYHVGVYLPNVGFTFTPEGRGLVVQQMALIRKARKAFGADEAASYLLYGREGAALPTAASDSDRKSVIGKALVRRRGSWFVCLSGYRCTPSASRWIQDRQNMVSIYHDRLGLIVGGGNTKLQPLWSTFTVGDTSLLAHKPGDTAPEFAAPKGIYHVPSAAGLKKSDPPGLGLKYGKERCSVEVEPVDENTLTICLHSTVSSGMPVEAHITLMPRLGKPFATEKQPARVLGNESFALSSEEAGGWIEHGGARLTLPRGSRITWPALPHNPYRKDGAAEPGEGRIVVTVPLTPDKPDQVLTLSVE